MAEPQNKHAKWGVLQKGRSFSKKPSALLLSLQKAKISNKIVVEVFSKPLKKLFLRQKASEDESGKRKT